ncbi:MAG TPA: phosphatase PAP2 family protein [Bryobacteraceae bacterium]|jgi:undecaprenyl-diphosphatase|nr:phosphatase PAP2 family protein [Bryobacteraceae bacterium]
MRQHNQNDSVPRSNRLRILLSRLTSLEKQELTTLVLLAVISAGVWIFIAIGSEVLEGDTQALDRKLLLALREPNDTRDPLGPPWLEEAARDVTALGGLTLLAFITLAISGFLMLEGKAQMAAFVLGAVVTGMILSTALKDLYHRPRPELVPHSVYVYGTSFPSGHSMMSAITYLTLGALLARAHRQIRLKVYVIFLAVFVTFAVGVSRVYLGVHWPTDVLAGWTAGAVWAVICWTVARQLQRAHQIEDEQAPGLDEHPTKAT